MSDRSAKRGDPDPRVATMPVCATGCLNGMSSALSCCRRYALVRCSSNASSGMRCNVLQCNDVNLHLIHGTCAPLGSVTSCSHMLLADICEQRSSASVAVRGIAGMSGLSLGTWCTYAVESTIGTASSCPARVKRCPTRRCSFVCKAEQSMRSVQMHRTAHLRCWTMSSACACASANSCCSKVSFAAVHRS